MTQLSRLLVFVFGVALVVTGLALWISGGLTLPTRHPPVRFHLAGLPLFLLGASPVLSGSTLLAIGSGRLDAGARITRALLLAATAMLALAFVLAPRH